MRGFNLIEIFLIIITIFILFALILPLGFNFYERQQLQAHSQQILQTLRRAQLKAMAGEAESSFGIYITNDNYTLFKGNSYATRDSQYDEVFVLPQIITVQNPPKEIAFSKLKGKPNLIGDIIINSDGSTQTISINEIGRINLEL